MVGIQAWITLICYPNLNEENRSLPCVIAHDRTRRQTLCPLVLSVIWLPPSEPIAHHISPNSVLSLPSTHGASYPKNQWPPFFPHLPAPYKYIMSILCDTPFLNPEGSLGKPFPSAARPMHWFALAWHWFALVCIGLALLCIFASLHVGLALKPRHYVFEVK